MTEFNQIKDDALDTLVNEVMNAACAQLMELGCESVGIVVTRPLPDGETELRRVSRGNQFAVDRSLEVWLQIRQHGSDGAIEEYDDD